MPRGGKRVISRPARLGRCDSARPGAPRHRPEPRHRAEPPQRRKRPKRMRRCKHHPHMPLRSRPVRVPTHLCGVGSYARADLRQRSIVLEMRVVSCPPNRHAGAVRRHRRRTEGPLKVWISSRRKVWYISGQGLAAVGRQGINNVGMAMAALERDSVQSEQFHDFKWHRQHRGQHSIQLVDVAMCLGWAVLLGWVLFHQ
jgi:hypothetical protein